jgi:hypothetical protein
MLRQITGRIVAYVFLGLFGLLIVSSLTALSGHYPMNIVLIGVGVVGTSLVLVFLQLRFWRVGEARNSEGDRSPVRLGNWPAPAELRNPRMRHIWENMETTRRLMELKEVVAGERERKEEKKRLGLDEEEDILFMEERSWLAFWPVVALSLAFLLASALASGHPMASFVCLTIGLGGLLLLTVLKGCSRYYLTNFRVLIRERIIMGRCRWASLPYADIRKCSLDGRFGGGGVKLEGCREVLALRGLPRPRLEAAVEVLRERLPPQAFG